VIDLLPGTRTYTRLGSPAEVVEIPALGVLLGGVIEADIAP